MSEERKILVVDDDEAIRDLLVEYLPSIFKNTFKREGYLFIPKKDGLQALEWIGENNSLEILLTDLEMPRLGGIELLEEIHNKDYRKKIKCIGIMSGNLITGGKCLVQIPKENYDFLLSKLSITADLPNLIKTHYIDKYS